MIQRHENIVKKSAENKIMHLKQKKSFDLLMKKVNSFRFLILFIASSYSEWLIIIILFFIVGVFLCS